MKTFLYFFAILFHTVINAEYSIIYVHIGNVLPTYLETSMAQARLFNQDCPIILIANEKALVNFDSPSNITTVSCESLPFTKEHEDFCRNTRHRNDFWRYTSERFLYLYDYMTTADVVDIFHLESDVMLYTDLKSLLPLFKQYYPGIATTFEKPTKCIPGFVYIGNTGVMQKLAIDFAANASREWSDMKTIGMFKKKSSHEIIGALPTLIKGYVDEQSRYFQDPRILTKRYELSNHIKAFESIFDAAAIGIYLGGIDPTKMPSPPYYSNPYLFFNPSLLLIHWHNDEKGRKIPYATYGKETYKINNLHIASKKLSLFKSN